MGSQMLKKIAIIGDGVAGRTLARVLKEAKFDVELFGRKHHNACGIRPCGWGTSGSCIRLLARLIRYPVTLRHDYFVLLDGRRIRGDLFSIDKPKLLQALYSDVRYDEPDINNCDLLVDATGLSRSLLPLADDDKQARNYQYRVRTGMPLYPSFTLVRGGYLWTIPLGENEAHIGGGSTELPNGEIKRLVQERVQQYRGEVICGCYEPIRLSGLLAPALSHRLVGVGESVGTVVPFGGGGIHPSIEGALILAKHIVKGSLEGYTRAMRAKFGWLRRSRGIIEGLPEVSLLSLPLAYRALRYQGLRPTTGDLIYIRRKLMEANRQC